MKNILLAMLIFTSSVALATVPSANISIALYAETNFALASGSNTAFVYNTSINFGKSVFSSRADGFVAGTGPLRPAAPGGFANGGNCDLCASSGNNSNPGIQTLSASSFDGRISSNDVAADSGGYIFVADAASKDSTANVATVTAATTEPKTYALMLAALGLMGFVVNRRRQQDA